MQIKIYEGFVLHLIKLYKDQYFDKSIFLRWLAKWFVSFYKKLLRIMRNIYYEDWCYLNGHDDTFNKLSFLIALIMEALLYFYEIFDFGVIYELFYLELLTLRLFNQFCWTIIKS